MKSDEYVRIKPSLAMSDGGITELNPSSLPAEGDDYFGSI